MVENIGFTEGLGHPFPKRSPEKAITSIRKLNCTLKDRAVQVKVRQVVCPRNVDKLVPVLLPRIIG